MDIKTGKEILGQYNNVEHDRLLDAIVQLILHLKWKVDNKNNKIKELEADKQARDILILGYEDKLKELGVIKWTYK